MEEGNRPRIVGGHPVLDLVNTVAPRTPGGSGHDYLAAPDDLLAWARTADVVDTGRADAVADAWRAEPAAAAQAFLATIEIREAAYIALAARLPATAGDALDAGPALEHLSLRWASAAARSVLAPGERSDRAARLVVGTAHALLIPDLLAHAAVDLLLNADLGRLRVCPVDEGGCGWLFLDHSRNGSRRWCAMADCGSQAKARRLTERRRVARATNVKP